MKVLLTFHFLWAALLAFLWSPDKSSDTFDIVLALVCYGWVVCAFALFFRARWAWWGSTIAAAGVASFLARGVIFWILRDSGRLPASGWPGWSIMLSFFVPTLAALVTLILVREFYIRSVSKAAQPPEIS